MSVTSVHVGSRPDAPPIRLRFVLLIALIGLALFWTYPRAIAAWRLHTTAGALADYGLCMAGPTGPASLRDGSARFRRLVRRRLIAAAPDERVFSRCAKLAREVTGEVAVERAHQAAASEFVEYGGTAADRAEAGSRGELTLDDLRVTVQPVAELSRQAWPFIRDGYVRRIRPSMNAREAVHPVELPRPAVGHGLPVWRAHYRAVSQTADGYLVAFGKSANLSVYSSRDGGVSWRPASLRDPRLQQFAERCPTGDSGKSFEVALSSDTKRWITVSAGPEGAPETKDLGPAELELFALSCDETGLVAALKAESSPEVQLVLCRHRGACGPMQLPRFGAVPVRFPLDLARSGGATIVAVNMHDIVRVTSTRDDGRTWTPFSVAFDRAAHPEVRTEVAVPARLLPLGDRVLLYGGAQTPSATYPVLISEDFGASFKAPGDFALTARLND